MTASEHLRQLDGAIAQFEHGYFLPERTASVIAALPLIVDCIEAAENEAHRLHPTTMELCTDPMCRALTALQQHLEGGTP